MVVCDVIPSGPSDGALEPGDVLLSVDGAEIVHFLPLEAALDDAVGRSVRVVVDRGGERIVVEVAVQDLHAVTPAAYLEIAGGILHPLSYQVACSHRSPTGLLYVADPGHTLGRAGVPRGAVVTALAHTPTPTASAFAAVLAAQTPGSRIPVDWYEFSDRGRPRVGLATVDAGWFGPPVFWERDAVAGGSWRASSTPPASLGGGMKLDVASLSLEGGEGGGGGDSVSDDDDGDAPDDDPPADASSPSSPRAWLATIDVDVPVVALADGVHARAFSGAAIIVAHDPARGFGLAVVDRNTIPIAPVDARLSFGGYPADVAAHPAFLHPQHNFAIVAYSTADLPPAAAAAIQAAPLDAAPLTPGARLTLAGLASDGGVVRRSVAVVHPASPLSASPADVPRFRAVHEVTIKLEHDYGSYAGALVTGEGAVAGLWASYSEQRDSDDREFCSGLPTASFAPWVAAVVASFEGLPARVPPPPSVPVLDAEFAPLSLARAARYGVPPAWIARLAATGSDRRTALRVRATLAGSSAAAVLAAGDVLLAVGGVPVVDYPGLEAAVAAAAKGGGGESGDGSTPPPHHHPAHPHHRPRLQSHRRPPRPLPGARPGHHPHRALVWRPDSGPPSRGAGAGARAAVWRLWGLCLPLAPRLPRPPLLPVCVELDCVDQWGGDAGCRRVSCGCAVAAAPRAGAGGFGPRGDDQAKSAHPQARPGVLAHRRAGAGGGGVPPGRGGRVDADGGGVREVKMNSVCVCVCACVCLTACVCVCVLHGGLPVLLFWCGSQTVFISHLCVKKRVFMCFYRVSTDE